ncbi:kinase-like domain-containing protein [Aspergillus keveii]|uniref:non-specific serine/threonine protein kinase n=1 Tax=Aspergillus keveii TaxID=714993 RepID=A0ABR4FH26_9EURO
MPHCFLPFLQRPRKHSASLTRAGDINLDEESHRLLSTEGLTLRDSVPSPRGKFSSTGIGKYNTPKKDRFVRTSGGHKHYLSPPRPRRHFCGSNDSEELSGRNKLFNSFKSQWMEGKQQEETSLAGWPIENRDMEAITQRYGEIQMVAGYGSYALVLISHKVRNWGPQLDRYYAIKIFRHASAQTESDYYRRATSEFSITSSLHHQNIIEAFEILPLGYDSLCVCMEYCSGGDLHALTVSSRRLLEDEADCFLKQLLCGILYIHEMGIAHRDLKPENLLLTNYGRLKISDFGHAECFRLAWEDQVHMSTRRCGSVPYVSPEQYLAQPFDPRYADIWAAAIVYIAMRAGRNPWKSATVKDECFRDYTEDCKAGSQYFLIRDITHVRLSLSFHHLGG